MLTSPSNYTQSDHFFPPRIQSPSCKQSSSPGLSASHLLPSKLFNVAAKMILLKYQISTPDFTMTPNFTQSRSQSPCDGLICLFSPIISYDLNSILFIPWVSFHFSATPLPLLLFLSWNRYIANSLLLCKAFSDVTLKASPHQHLTLEFILVAIPSLLPSSLILFFFFFFHFLMDLIMITIIACCFPLEGKFHERRGLHFILSHLASDGSEMPRMEFST